MRDRVHRRGSDAKGRASSRPRALRRRAGVRRLSRVFEREEVAIPSTALPFTFPHTSGRSFTGSRGAGQSRLRSPPENIPHPSSNTRPSVQTDGGLPVPCVRPITLIGLLPLLAHSLAAATTPASA